MIIETHTTDQSDLFIQLYNEGKTIKEIRDTLQIGFTAYRTYLRNNKQHLKPETKTCPVCGKTFTKKTPTHTYCSLQCKEKAKIKYKTCPICGKQFKPNSSSHKYCTPECAKIAQRENQRQNYHKHRDEILLRRKEQYNQNKKEEATLKCVMKKQQD